MSQCGSFLWSSCYINLEGADSMIIAAYKNHRGVLAYDKTKPIFPHRGSNTQVKPGLVRIIPGTLRDFKSYAFANMDNVMGLIPREYRTIDTFANIGVPLKFYKGVYGDSLFVKEVYRSNAYIKSFDIRGTLIFKEAHYVRGKEMNPCFSRMDEAVTSWEEVSDAMLVDISDSIMSKKSDLTILTPVLLDALKHIYKNGVKRSENGVIYANGDHESLLIWSINGQYKMSWLGRHVLPPTGHEDITVEVEKGLNLLYHPRALG